ncbi:MAG: ribokinase [Armatimonadetes bacterium]|nr:ribokinase [Armatimonadota bacterium]
MSSPQVAVVGSANLDLVFNTDRLPVPGETVLGGKFATHPGGKGANQAAAIARLGGQASLVGCVGTDANGRVLRSALTEIGVRVEFLQDDPHTPSGTAGILVDRSGANMIVVAPGSNFSVTPDQVQAAINSLNPDIVLAQLELNLDAVQAASHAKRFILNPAPSQPLPDEILAQCEVITPNESELKALTGISPTDASTCEQGSRILLDRGVSNVVVTLGDRGSYWTSASSGRHFPPIAVQAVDTTAAGDAFNGALAWFLATGREMANAIQLANCVGALSTTKPGAQESMPTWEEFAAVASEWL